MRPLALLLAVLGLLATPMPSAAQSVGLFTVYGPVTSGGIDPLPPECSIQVERKQGGTKVASRTVPASFFPEGTYAIVFFDSENLGEVAALGDEFVVTVIDPDDQLMNSESIVVTQDHLDQFGVEIEIVAIKVAIESATFGSIKHLYRTR